MMLFLFRDILRRFLPVKFVRRGIQKIIGGYIIELAKRNEVPHGHFIGTALITGIHCLGCAENICNLLLGQVIIFAQTTQFVRKCLHIITPCYNMPIV